MARYKVVLKGKEEDIIIDSLEAAKLMQDLKSGEAVGMIEIGGNVVSVGAIKGIFPLEDVFKGADGLAKIAKIEREYQEWRETEMEKPTEERARNISWAKMAWKMFRGREMTEEEEKNVIERNGRWLSERPTFHCAPAFIEMVQPAEPNHVPGNAYHISEVLKKNFVYLMERNLTA